MELQHLFQADLPPTTTLCILYYEFKLKLTEVQVLLPLKNYTLKLH